MIRAFDVVLRNDFLFKFSKYSDQYRNAVDTLHRFTDQVIQDRRKELLIKAAHEDEAIENGRSKKRKLAFLDILLQSTTEGKPLSDLDIREEVDTFMFEVYTVHFHITNDLWFSTKKFFYPKHKGPRYHDHSHTFLFVQHSQASVGTGKMFSGNCRYYRCGPKETSQIHRTVQSSVFGESHKGNTANVSAGADNRQITQRGGHNK